MGAMEVDLLVRLFGSFSILATLTILTLREIVKSDVFQIPVVNQRNFVGKQSPIISAGNSQNLIMLPNGNIKKNTRRGLIDGKISECGISGCGIHKPINQNIQRGIKTIVSMEVKISLASRQIYVLG